METQTSIATAYNYATPIEQQLKRIARTGFSHVSLGANLKHCDYTDRAVRSALRLSAKNLGLGFDTLHAPSLDRDDAEEVISNAIYAAADLEVPIVVTHPVPFVLDPATESAVRTKIVQAIERLELILERLGSVRLAVENVHPGPATDLIEPIMEGTSADLVGFCYDSSHEQVDGPNPYRLCSKYGERLIAVHLSDRVRPFVDHLIPGEGFVDFVQIQKDLVASGFDAPVLLEVMMEHSKYKDEMEFLQMAKEAAEGIADRLRAA